MYELKDFKPVLTKAANYLALSGLDMTDPFYMRYNALQDAFRFMGISLYHELQKDALEVKLAASDGILLERLPYYNIHPRK